MSPSVREINGPRPSPLKIHKDSHQIQKPTVANAGHQQRQQPIIIYTHSPKVIHTQARDFMALVQKLTGLSRAPKEDDNNNDEDDDDDNSIDSSSNNNKRSELKPKLSPPPPPLDKAAREQQQQGPQSGYGDMINPSAAVAAAAAATIFGFDCPGFGISEIPMLTPNAADHIFCSPNSKSLYRYSPSAEAKVLPEF